MITTTMLERFSDSMTAPGIAPRIGRGLFAVADFDTGDDLLHIQTPFLAVLNTERLGDTCAGCFGKRQFEKTSQEIQLRYCSGCQIPKYCDRTCQVKDWHLGHRFECSIFKALKPRVLPTNARAVLRIILRLAAPARSAYSSKELSLLDQLESHIDEIRDKNTASWERITLSAMAVKHYSGTDMELEEILELSAKLEVNSFSLTTATYDRIGMYMHPYAAIMNHDCHYNAIVGFDGPQMYVKAIRPIKDGEQIVISYVDATNRYSVRKKELLERYYFTCRCDKCLVDEDEPLAMSDAVADAYALLESNSATYEGDKLLGIITNLTDNTWSLSDQPLVALVDEYIATLISEGEMESAMSAAALRYKYIDPDIYSEAHSLRVVHAWALAKIAIHIAHTSVMAVLKVYGYTTADGVVHQGEKIVVNPGMIAWSVLNSLVFEGHGSCVVPGLKDIIRRTYTQVHDEFLEQGTDMREMNDRVRIEWEKVERAAKSIVGDRTMTPINAPLLPTADSDLSDLDVW
ncbi:SET and MYND domain protein [Aspergillus pseudodeflectus]|uniref:SET and MYND domain protein n=1 Tax=Aspergillus pseudodeflectus TaxID=176178 RepID=A0ABR4KZE6_9EURO